MRAATPIGPYRTVAALTADRWSVTGPVEGAVAHRLDGSPDLAFEQKATRLMALIHPHLWPLLAAARVDGQPWIVTPTLRGGTLADRLAAGHQPPYKVAIDVGVAVLRGLAAAHEAGFTHGALDPGCIGWAEGRVQVLGVGHGALVGRSAAPVDDLRAVARLIGALVADPPGELRALLAGPPPTAEAFCRALKTLDPALGLDRDFDFSRPTPRATPTPEAAPPTATSAPSAPAEVPDDPPPARPAASAEETWGVEAPIGEAAPPAQGKGWVVASRDLVEASTEDTWGVGSGDAPPPPTEGLQRSHTGSVVHTVTTARTAAKPRGERNMLSTIAVSIAVIAVVLVGARIVMNQLAAPETLPQPTVAPGLVALDGSPPPADAGIADAGIADAAADAAPPDAAPETRVMLLIGPVPARVVRVADKAVICDGVNRCSVPIDIDYRVEAKGHISQTISGDDLYDRRRIGRLELVLQPVAPKPKKGRRLK